MGNNVILCHEHHDYAFLVFLDSTNIATLRTRHLLGAHMYSGKGKVEIYKPAQLSMIQDNIYRLYKIPETELRIHLNVPMFSGMDWHILPIRQEMNYFIYMEG